MLQDLTYKQTPQSIILKVLSGLTISVIVYLLVAGTTINLTLLVIVVVGFVLFISFYFESQFYDGISINSESIQVSKNSIFHGRVEHQLKLNDIQRITYSKGINRTPQHIIIESERITSQLKVTIGESIFKFAYILRELKRNKVDVKLRHPDHEVQLFLDERIPDLPMTNDMEIR